MRALWFEGGCARLRTDLPEPSPPRKWSRVRVLRAGICATDLALLAGYMGFRGVPGHEFVGIALDGPLGGQRVVGEINAACGSCPTCDAGSPGHCPDRRVLGIAGLAGAFADELVLPQANLHPLPPGVDDDAATFVEPLAAACEIPCQVPVDGRRCLILGDGRLGLLSGRVLALEGADVALHGHHPERAELFELPWEADPPANAYDLVVEATGRPEGLSLALSYLRPRGVLVLKSTTAEEVRLDLAPLVVNEITLVGSRCGPFPRALELLASGRVPVERLIEARYPLEQGPQALQEAGAGGRLKVLLDIAGEPR